MAKSLAERIRKFVSIRNKSDFQSNLQFQFDLDEAGLKVSDIGQPIKQAEGCYVWETDAGDLIETYGKMEFQPQSANA